MKPTHKLKPRRMWCDRELFATPTEVVVCGNKKEFKGDLPVAVIPLDDPDALIATAADAHYAALKLDADLIREREKVRALREACGIIERKAGEDYDERDPLSDVGDIASKALAATEDKP